MKAIAFLSLILSGATALVAFRGTAQDAARPAPTTDGPMSGCAESGCHAPVKNVAHLHGPLNINACDACHRLVDATTHAYELQRPRDQLCLYCHEFSVPPDHRLHTPLTGGECLACHDPHGSDVRQMLRQGPQRDLCLTCHADVTGGKPMVHGPLKEGTCTACHEPHSSPNPNLLKVDGRELCLECHPTTRLELDVMNVTHAPVEGDCLVCHDPHATTGESLLNVDKQSLCLSCHDEIGELMRSSHGQHAAVTTERGCLNCHVAHASDHTRLLKEEAAALCLDCHDQPLERTEGGTIMDMKAFLQDHLVLHAPVAQGNCVSCHMIHGGGLERLLTREYSTEMYNSMPDETYALCFVCHDRQSVSLPESTAVTQFRNGALNLHYVHVGLRPKSRSCHVCHDPHATNNEHDLRDSVPFGPNWTIKIDWQSTENGGTCAAGCHRSYHYDRVDPVQYPVRPVPNDGR